MRNFLCYNNQVATLILIIWIVGCTSENKTQFGLRDSMKPAVMEAVYADIPIQVDGKIDEDVWKRAKVYEMKFSRDRDKSGEKLKEEGQIRFAWDDKYFYLGASFKDSDIVAEGKADQLHHYRLGDVCELFLKPNGKSWYWELYVTPNNKKTSFWFPGRGRLGLPSGFEDYRCGLKVASRCIGTLNDWTDIDKGWTAEMAMPIEDLTVRGEDFGLGASWRILVSRFNYSRYLYNKELSMAPELSQTNFHLLQEYAVLRLVK